MLLLIPIKNRALAIKNQEVAAVFLLKYLNDRRAAANWIIIDVIIIKSAIIFSRYYLKSQDGPPAEVYIFNIMLRFQAEKIVARV